MAGVWLREATTRAWSWAALSLECLTMFGGQGGVMAVLLAEMITDVNTHTSHIYIVF